MNREEAQFILGAYRLNGEDAHDPQFQEALSLVQHDPELGRWFSEQQALDRALSAKLRGRPVPAELKPLLLLARTTSRRRAKSAWRRPLWLAAAGFAVLLAAAAPLLLRNRSNTLAFNAFRGAMLAASADMEDHMDVMGLELAGYREWLIENRGTPDFALPTSLAKKGISACKIIEWQGHRVTMLCMKFGGQHLDVFVVDASELPRVSPSETPRYFEDQGVTGAAWQNAGKIYLVTGTMPKEDLQKLL